MARNLPTGTITFLFTDMEGSTKLLHELGAADYAHALAEHRRLLRDAFTTHGGIEVDTQGDAFFVAFPSAPGAVAAAHQAQQALAELPLRVRMGLHTGTPLLAEEGYVGADVHRAARVAAAGHGGQVLLTSATAALIGEHVAGVALRDVGIHRLKDLSAPERIYQLGQEDFPPLRSLYQTNLPVPPTPFLGRGPEVASVVGLASRPEVRLLTLTGPGGTGKTRLAQQSAAELGDRYPGGVWWIPLASLRDPALVLDTASRVVGARDGLADHIGASATLLVFDNFEQVVEAATDVAAVLGACPNLRILVTSREALRVAGEHEYPVPPLAPNDAAELFTARATAADPAFADDGAVAQICRRLDELPLAIELAAARVKVLSPNQILARLERRLPLLTGGARDLPERQRTLRATIEWSYELLADDERRLFARLAIFRGGCTLEAAEAVTEANLDELQSLVDKSLLRHRDDRFAMLETIREYAAERLAESADGEQIRHLHTEYFQRLAHQAEPHLQLDEIAWVNRVDVDHDNLRAILERLEAEADWEAVLELAGTLHRFWYLRGHLAEGRRQLEIALAADGSPTPARAKALRAGSVMALNLGETLAARRYAEQALELYRGLGDSWGEAYSLMMIGNALGDANDATAGRPFLEQAMARFEELADEHYVLIALSNYAWMTEEIEGAGAARPYYEQLLRRTKAIDDERGAASALESLAFYARDEGRLEESAEMFRDAIAVHSRRGELLDLGITLGRLASVLVRMGSAREAAQVLGASDALLESVGHAQAFWEVRRNEETVRLIGEHLTETESAAAREHGGRLSVDDAVALAMGQSDSAQPRSASGT